MANQLLDQCKINADSIQKTQGGLILSGTNVAVELLSAPRRYLYSGWQSWSLTAWVDASRRISPLRPSIMHPRETDPVYTRETRPNGAWYGAVEMGEDKIIFLGALGLESHVILDSQTLEGTYEAGSGDWLFMIGDEADIFSRYVQFLEERYGKYRIKDPYRVWCSWYSLYDEIDAGRLEKILTDLGDLPFDVFQIDDGWQKGVGNWEPNAKFPEGMGTMADKIHATRRKAGLWLAPLLIAPSSDIFHEHRDWLLNDEHGRLVSAGYNWGDTVYALDTTHPEALEWLRRLMEKVRTWGYEYVKLDFLYAGALPGKRHEGIPRETAYRNGLGAMRAALGDSYLLACGCPILPSLGLCDGMRIGQDVGEYWNSHLFDDILINYSTPGVWNALRNTLNRLWLKPLVHTDPDVVFFRSRQNQLTPLQRSLFQDLALIAGFKATSDIPAWLAEPELVTLRAFLELLPRIQKKGRASFMIDDRFVDFGPYTGIPPLPDPFTNFIGAIVGAFADIPVVMKGFDAINRKSLKTRLKKNPV